MDFAALPPWRDSPHRLVPAFLDVIERSAPQLRKTVRLTLGLDAPTESLGERRQMRQAGKAGGNQLLLQEKYALTRVLVGLMAYDVEEAAPRRPIQPLGFSIERVFLAIRPVVTSPEHTHHMRLWATCQRDGEQALLVPATGDFAEGAHCGVAVERDGEALPGSMCTPARVRIHPHSDEHGFYYAIPLPASLKGGDKVQLILTASSRQFGGPAPPLSRRLWWRTLGTEERIDLALQVEPGADEMIPGYMVEAVDRADPVPEVEIGEHAARSLDVKTSGPRSRDELLQGFHTWRLVEKQASPWRRLELTWAYSSDYKLLD